MRHWRLHWLANGIVAVVRKARGASKPAGPDLWVLGGRNRKFPVAAVDCMPAGRAPPSERWMPTSYLCRVAQKAAASDPYIYIRSISSNVIG
jgi:hypothetical protein